MAALAAIDATVLWLILILHKGLDDGTGSTLMLEFALSNHLLEGVPDRCESSKFLFHKMQLVQGQVMRQVTGLRATQLEQSCNVL